ncbi:MAG: SDR family oxidoreductase [Candidatus Binataceae bacterium]|nr:SDR family oxidoreductase [Candidatus Binataceae bacterium]
MQAQFKGKIALITGAGAGIGHAIAIEWGRRGGFAIVTDMVAEQARDTAAEIERAGGRAIHRSLDVKRLDQIRETFAGAIAEAGGLDVLFNVAGTNLMRNVEEMEDEEWYSIIDTNLTSVYRCSKIAVPEIRKRGGGAIVNTASIAGILAENRCAAYSASKGGVILLTRNMAMDFAPYGIRVNAICPGSTRTPRTESYLRKAPGQERAIADLAPMKRFAEPEEIARPAIFLASDEASYITGASLVVDGGLTAGFKLPLFDQL